MQCMMHYESDQCAVNGCPECIFISRSLCGSTQERLPTPEMTLDALSGFVTSMTSARMSGTSATRAPSLPVSTSVATTCTNAACHKTLALTGPTAWRLVQGEKEQRLRRHGGASICAAGGMTACDPGRSGGMKVELNIVT